MISSLQDFKTYVDQACRAADEFVNIYYETMDKRRRECLRMKWKQLYLALKAFIDHIDVVSCNRYLHQKRAVETVLWNLKCTMIVI
ncbi:ntf2-related export protein 2 [Limosa lapponica baueri]|uniref:Ntf2-related export protein 2 n=1 Tax=Limosa lapponica baueri TaxID=1758121 RepID=A0A2I0U1G3_LIMLA|nr:ntf2-related export protein 2 [Limosa lapponica baueri]